MFNALSETVMCTLYSDNFGFISLAAATARVLNSIPSRRLNAEGKGEDAEEKFPRSLASSPKFAPLGGKCGAVYTSEIPDGHKAEKDEQSDKADHKDGVLDDRARLIIGTNTV